MIWAIVPAKVLERAKTRLANLLTPAERRILSVAMLRDVLAALRSVRQIDRVVVVTRDERLEHEVRAWGAEIFPEQRAGHISALEDALAACRVAGASGALIVSADLPLLRAVTIEHMLMHGLGESHPQLALLAPSRDGTGTNAMFQRPPGVIPLRFGPDSLRQHQQAAYEAQVAVDLFHAPELAFDVDTPADLFDLALLAQRSHTQAVIRQRQLLRRVQQRFIEAHLSLGLEVP